MLSEKELERSNDDCRDPKSPSAESNLSLRKQDKSVASTLCTIDREGSSESCMNASKSFKFRPRFADEGLEDFESDDGISEREFSLETPAAGIGDTEDLRSAVKVGTEIEREIAERHEVLASDLLRE